MNTPDPSDLPIIDNNAIDELREIMEDDFADLVGTLLRDMPLQLADIQAAVDRGDAETLYRTAHKLKSGSGSIGAPQLSELARQLELLGRSGDLTDVAPVLEQIRITAARTWIGFQALLDG